MRLMKNYLKSELTIYCGCINGSLKRFKHLSQKIECLVKEILKMILAMNSESSQNEIQKTSNSGKNSHPYLSRKLRKSSIFSIFIQPSISVKVSTNDSDFLVQMKRNIQISSTR